MINHIFLIFYGRWINFIKNRKFGGDWFYALVAGKYVSLLKHLVSLSIFQENSAKYATGIYAVDLYFLAQNDFPIFTKE